MAFQDMLKSGNINSGKETLCNVAIRPESPKGSKEKNNITRVEHTVCFFSSRKAKRAEKYFGETRFESTYFGRTSWQNNNMMRLFFPLFILVLASYFWNRSSLPFHFPVCELYTARRGATERVYFRHTALAAVTHNININRKKLQWNRKKQKIKIKKHQFDAFHHVSSSFLCIKKTKHAIVFLGKMCSTFILPCWNQQHVSDSGTEK